MAYPKVVNEMAQFISQCPLHLPQWRRLRIAVSSEEAKEMAFEFRRQGRKYHHKIFGVPLVIDDKPEGN